jgi:MFS family permease
MTDRPGPAGSPNTTADPPNVEAPAGSADSTGEPGESSERSSALAWFTELSPGGRRAFRGAFLGYGLDSYDFWVLPLSLAAIAAAFSLTTPQTGLLSTATLVSSALGGLIAGILADRIGRVRTLMVTVLAYAVFTALCGLAPNYETLLVFRALQGLGFGGEWAAGAILVAEYASDRHRGRTVAMVQSAWAVGWGLAVIVYTLVFNVFDEGTAWRVLFLTGAAPALLVFYLRRNLAEAPVFLEHRQTHDRPPLLTIFRRPLAGTTFFASLLATGCQGGYYTLATWVPSYLKNDRGLSVVGTGGYLTFLISGAYCGYLTGGYFTDRLGRKLTFRIFAVLSGIFIILYTQLPAGANSYVLFLGFPLGFTSSAIFSGMGAYLSELYPSGVRGIGQGFTYNVGRAIGAFFPTVIGFLAVNYGIGGAMAFGALAYALVVVALLGLPETRARVLT